MGKSWGEGYVSLKWDTTLVAMKQSISNQLLVKDSFVWSAGSFTVYFMLDNNKLLSGGRYNVTIRDIVNNKCF